MSEYTVMMTVRRHAWYRPMRTQIPPPAAENSPRVVADKDAVGSAGLWVLLMKG